MPNSSEQKTISGTHCDACHLPIAKGEATMRGDGRTVSRWHRDCFTVVRATQEVCAELVAEETLFGSLLERLQRAGLR